MTFESIREATGHRPVGGMLASTSWDKNQF